MSAAPAWAEDLKASVSTLTATVGTLATDLSTLTKTVVSNHDVVLARLDALDTRVGKIDERVERIETDVKVLAAARANEAVRLANTLKACDAPLKALRFDCVGQLWPTHVKQPATLLDLAVSGAETKPGTAMRADWNVARSRAFLRAAVDGYETDGTDGEGEIGAVARTARIKVIQAVGGDVVAVLATTYKLS